MIPKELARKIRYLEIYTSKAVNDILAGEYESVFKGRGMEFSEVREYTPGDEIRTIDWNVTARLGHPFVKRFVEERELTVLLLVDLSASGSFGSQERSKNELAAELCALLAFAAIKNNDKVGLLVFTDAIELFIPPRKGVAHVLRLIRELLSFKPRQTRTNIKTALDYLARVIRKRCVVFLVSDFQAQGFDKALRILSKRHDVIALTVLDPRELELPPVGLVTLTDAETGAQALVDAGYPAARAAYAASGRRRREELRGLLSSMAIDQIELLNGSDCLKQLVLFFKRREKRM